MRLCRLIASKWLKEQDPSVRPLEGVFTDAQLAERNLEGYNVYYLPNHPQEYSPGRPTDGADIDVWNFAFVDMDLKDGKYPDKETFIAKLTASNLPPTKIVDSGGGVHAYWKVENLDAKSYLRFQRRLCRFFDTDEATSSLFQLMRLPGSFNTKIKDDYRECKVLSKSGPAYTAEQLDGLLPPVTTEDEAKCVEHYDRVHNLNQDNSPISDALPPKFGKLLKDVPEAKEIWAGSTEDRSKNDYRLGHLMFANEFTRDEALSVLVNSAKAMSRSPAHRRSYAQNIVDKIWTFEQAPEVELNLSSSVTDILMKSGTTLKGTRFPCHPLIDSTEHGFRLGQVLGLVAGSGVGKTAFALNMFKWFAARNPEYHHFFIPLEQTVNEIADRWRTMCGEDTSLHSKVQVMSNYADDGTFRHLSFDDIKDYINKYQKVTGHKVGCIVIDHIGALKKKGKNGENQDLMDICHSMKAFAIETNTLLVMQSQAPREKAGIGDLELNKDAAYGTVYFESYCDYLVSIWQPLKRCHMEDACPTVTAFKFCKIRHKKAKKDVIKEDVPYYLFFDSETELMRNLTQMEEAAFNYYLPNATAQRKADRKTDIVKYQSVPLPKGESTDEETKAGSDRRARAH